MENSSIEFSKDQIRNMIKNHDWEFIFIGADIDSYAEAGHIGIKRSHIANYEKSSRGVEKAFMSMGMATDHVRFNRKLDNARWKKELNEYD